MEVGFAIAAKGGTQDEIVAAGFTPRVARGFVTGAAILREHNALDLPVAYTWETRAKDAMVMCRMLDGSWAITVAGKIAAFGDTKAEVVAEYAAVRNAPDYIRRRGLNPTGEAKRLQDVAKVVKDGKVTKGMRNAGSKAIVTPARVKANLERLNANLQ